MTATLDVAYPPDLLEGAIQVLLLNGHENLVWAKQYVTPAKLGLYSIAFLISLVALGIVVSRRFKSL